MNNDVNGRLLLSRRVGESIKINDNVTVTVISIHGTQCKLAIIAPREVSVHRQEIWEKIRQEDSSCSL